MLKNRHLLLLIALFAVGNVIACVLLIFSEKSKNQQIEELIGEVRDVRRQHAEFEASVATDLTQQKKELAQHRKSVAERETELQGALDIVRRQLAGVEVDLGRLKQLKWLTGGKAEDMPWNADIQSLRERLLKAEQQLKALLAPKPGPPSME